MADGWESDRGSRWSEGKVYAATDDKGQLFIHVKALESYLQSSGAGAGQRQVSHRGRRRGPSPNLTPLSRRILTC